MDGGGIELQLGLQELDWDIKCLPSSSIRCLYSRTTVTSVHIPEEDAYYRARNMCVSHVLKSRVPGLTHKGCVLQRISFGVLSDVTVVLGMRQSIEENCTLLHVHILNNQLAIMRWRRK